MNGSRREERVQAYVAPETKERIRQAAQRDGRSMSGYVASMLRRQLEIEERLYGADERQPHTLTT